MLHFTHCSFRDTFWCVVRFLVVPLIFFFLRDGAACVAAVPTVAVLLRFYTDSSGGLWGPSYGDSLAPGQLTPARTTGFVVDCYF